MKSNHSGLIWMNGELVAWQQAQVHCLSHTLHYGLGVLEGVRAYATDRGPAIFRLQDHTERLFRSAEIVGLKIDYTLDQLNQAQQDLLRVNHLRSAYLRPMVFCNAGPFNLTADNLPTQVIVAAWEIGTYLGEDALAKGIKVQTASFTRNHSNSIFCKAKANGNYLNSILALQEAKARGCEEALFLDKHGYVAEGSGENIFMVRNNILYTPTLSSVLEGITRATIMTLAESMGFAVQERDITLEELYAADELFFTGTAAEVTPICILDGKEIGNGRAGPVTLCLQTAYLNQVRGNGLLHPEWLTYIEPQRALASVL